MGWEKKRALKRRASKKERIEYCYWRRGVVRVGVGFEWFRGWTVDCQIHPNERRLAYINQFPFEREETNYKQNKNKTEK